MSKIENNILNDLRGKRKSNYHNFNEELLINIIIQEIVKNHVNDTLESIGVISKINFLLYPEETNELKIRELSERFRPKTSLTMDLKKKFRRQRQNIIKERDSGKCDICHPSKKLKQQHQINLR